uniref:ribosomal protein L35 n=1 Tax=Rhodella violacea TaxID=2801 RepID=UPI001FCD45DA|nr:ribosomal protein L35 [Rhodella violacea]UNJ18130.1 ribosomal protein L35 [Rhodella violacea]
MPKLKTRRSLLKRFKITANDKILRRQAFKSHLLGKKSARRKKNLSKVRLVYSGETKSILFHMK